MQDTVQVKIDKADYLIMAKEASKCGMDPDKFIAKMVGAMASDFREEQDRYDVNDAIIAVMRAKLEEMPNLVSLFSNERLKFDETASIMADKMDKMCERGDLWDGD